MRGAGIGGRGGNPGRVPAETVPASCAIASGSEQTIASPTGARAASPGVAGQVDEPGALRQRRARHELVVAERRGAGDDHDVVAGQRVGDAGDAGGELPAEGRVPGRERAAACRGREPRRRAERLREAHGIGVRPLRVDVGAEDEGRRAGAVEQGDEIVEDGGRQRPGRDGAAAGQVPGRPGCLDLPVVVGHRQVGRPGRWQGGHRDRLPHGPRHVLRAGRLGGVLDERTGQCLGVDVGEEHLLADHRAHLLPREQDERGVRVRGVGQHPHRVAGAGRGVQVDQCRHAAGLHEPVGHRQDGALVQAQDVAEVVGQPRQERQLVRAGVAEDGGEPAGPEHLVGHVANGRHDPVLTSSTGGQQTESVGVGTPMPSARRACSPTQVPASAARPHTQPDRLPDAMPAR